MPDQVPGRNLVAHQQTAATPAAGAGAVPNAHEAYTSDACILRHISKVSRAVVAAYDPALAPFGLTGHQFNLMMTLGNMGPMTVGALAEVLGMDASGIPRAIRPLADDGLIAVERGADRRQRLLSLTALGQQRLASATPAWASVQRELLDTIGPGRWVTLMNELRTVRRAAAGCSTRKTTPKK
jgi:DNA-binding MarR family transcriptional regulator